MTGSGIPCPRPRQSPPPTLPALRPTPPSCRLAIPATCHSRLLYRYPARSCSATIGHPRFKVRYPFIVPTVGPAHIVEPLIRSVILLTASPDQSPHLSPSLRTQPAPPPPRLSSILKLLDSPTPPPPRFRHRHVCCCGYAITPLHTPEILPVSLPARIHDGDCAQGQGTIDTTYSSVTSRPIRPLPKRRLRSRLSEDADAALFAAPPAPAAPLFYFPYSSYSGDAALGNSNSSGGFASGHGAGDGLHDSSDDEDNSNVSVSRGMGTGSSGNTDGPSGGNAGNADPYEWTENTNNKKKRKIPTHTNPGGSTSGGGMGGNCGGTHASSGFSPTSAPRSRWKSSGTSQRSPLSAMSSVNHSSLRRSNRRYTPSPSVESFNRIVTAKGREEPVTPSKGKPKDARGDSGLPKESQFTFVCDSPVSANLAYTSTPNPGAGGAKMQTVGTQTSPGMSNSTYQQTPLPTKKKSPKPSRRDIYQQQMRRRRQEAAHNNNGEVWICEFCEYEAIFGEPPEALMRQYEIKDRKERKRLAEKRRLLEKAKQKGKKNSGKNTGKKGGNHHGNAPPPPPPPSTTDSQGTQSDNTPLASAAQTPALKPTRQSQQVQTDSFLEGSSHVSTGRGASGVNGGAAKASTGDGGTSS
jgi:hypothetical protein